MTNDRPSFLSPPQQADEIGRLGHYRILKLLGEGGMGMVFRAEDTRLECIVALKVLKPDAGRDPALEQRFLREAKATAALRSDHVVTIHDVNREGAVLYLAMEHLKGESLETWLKKKQRLTTGGILRIGREIALGLAAAHARGLVHRDVKPANLWLEAPRGRIKILDFGLACLQDDPQHLAQSDVVVGTPSYLAPEQAASQPVDHRCDLFSLGNVLYHLCAGRQPFQGQNSRAVLTALLTREPEPLAKFNPALPRPLVELVMQLLSRKPEDRPQSAQDVVDAIRGIEGAFQEAGLQPVAPQARDVREDTEVHVPERPVRRRWPLVAAAGGGLIALAVGIFLLLHSFRNPDVPRPPVEDDRSVMPPPQLSPQKQVDEVVARLKELNPGFTGKYDARIDDNVVTGFTLADGAGVQNVSPVAVLKDLNSFWCRGNPIVDLAPLRGMKLRKLDVGWSQVQDLSALRGMPLEELVISHTQVADLSPLEGMPLRLLHCGLLKGVKDLSPLRRLPLTELRCEGISASDLTPLKDLPLTYLECPGLPAGTDLAPLGKLSRLTFLVCDVNHENDLTFLSGLRELKTLNYKPVSADFRKGREQVETVRAQLKERNRGFDGQLTPVIENGVLTELSFRTEQITDVSPLRELKGLKKLTCAGEYNMRKGRLVDLSPLKDLKLQHLECSFNGNLTDLSPLSGMPLVHLGVNMTGVKDLSPLVGIKLENLGIYHTPVRDLSPLRGMPLRGLNAFACQIADFSVVREMPLTDIYLLFDPMRDEALKALLRSIKTLKNINAVDSAKLLK